MSDVAAGPQAPEPLAAPLPGAPVAATPLTPRPRGEFVYYARRNAKLVAGLSVEALFVMFALIGPFISPHNTADYFLPHLAPSAQHWLGTDYFGHDVFAQLVNGLRESYLVGALGALCAASVGMALGFAVSRAGGGKVNGGAAR